MSYRLEIDFTNFDNQPDDVRKGYYNRLYSIVKQMQHSYSYKSIARAYGATRTTCKCCNFEIANSGKHIHIRSKKHIENCKKAGVDPRAKDLFIRVPDFLKQIEKYI